MSGWSKSFLDGTTICHTDDEVAAGKASWSRERLDHMCGASASINNRFISIAGLGDYWQSDDWEVNVSEPGPVKIVKRRLMKKLDSAERVMQVLQTEHSVMLRIIDVRFGAGHILAAETLETIPQNKDGHWIVLEYNVMDDTFRWYYSPERI